MVENAVLDYCVALEATVNHGWKCCFRLLKLLKKISNFHTHRQLEQKAECVWSGNPKNSWGLFSQLNHCWIALCLWVKAVKVGKNRLAFLNHHTYYFVHLCFGHELHWMEGQPGDDDRGLNRYSHPMILQQILILCTRFHSIFILITFELNFIQMKYYLLKVLQTQSIKNDLLKLFFYWQISQ